MEPKVALLGTGLLGTGMAEHMLAGGTPLTVWNRTAARAAPLAARGAQVATTVVDAVRGATRIHLVLHDDAAVDAVLAEISEGIVLDHTTTSPSRTLLRMLRFGSSSSSLSSSSPHPSFLHCPVFMSPANAREGKGIILACGPKPVFDRVEPGLRAMCGDLWYLGERGDLAAAYKLFGNAMLSAILGGLSDVMTMADAVGVPRTDALSLFDRFQPAGAIKGRGPRMAAGASGEPSFMVETARKDLGLMLETAGGADQVPILAAFARKLDALIAAGRGEEDLAAVGTRKVE